MIFLDVFNYVCISILTFIIGIVFFWLFGINSESLIVLVLPPLSFSLGLIGMVIEKERRTKKIMDIKCYKVLE